MSRHRDEFSNPLDLRDLQIGEGEPDSVRSSGDHLSPGVTNKGVAKAAPQRSVGGWIGALLAASNEIGLEFYGPRTAQYIPVIPAGFHSEGRGQNHNIYATARKFPKQV